MNVTIGSEVVWSPKHRPDMNIVFYGSRGGGLAMTTTTKTDSKFFSTDHLPLSLLGAMQHRSEVAGPPLGTETEKLYGGHCARTTWQNTDTTHWT